MGQYRTTDVAENLGKFLSGTQRICQGKDFEVILTVKIETRHPIGKRSLSNNRHCVDRAKNLPGAAPDIWLTLFHISSKSVHFRRSYCRTREDRFCPIYKRPLTEINVIASFCALNLRVKF